MRGCRGEKTAREYRAVVGSPSDPATRVSRPCDRVARVSWRIGRGRTEARASGAVEWKLLLPVPAPVLGNRFVPAT